MTFYHQQVIDIRNNVYPKEYLCDQVMQAKKFIDENFTETIYLDDISTSACFSKYHFLRLFKVIYGTTPHQYLTAVRIDKAKQLLRTGLSVSDVCSLTGFESISSFKALFKRSTGSTPSAYQQRKTDSQEISQTVYRFLPLFFFAKKSNFQDR